MVYRPVPRTDIIRDGDKQDQPAKHKNYLIQTTGKASAKAKRLLHALGAGDAIGGITFVATLTNTQVARLSQQPWIGSVAEEQIMHTMSQATAVVREKVQPQTWGVYTNKKPTKAQADILWLLGADVADLSVRAFELELTAVQVERLQTQKWVKQVAASTQFHTCAPGQSVTAPAAATGPDFSKIDAKLSSELQNRRHPDSKEIDLFISTVVVPNAEQVAELAALGVNDTARKTTLFTAKLSQNEIAALSNKAWVKALRGSNRARPC